VKRIEGVVEKLVSGGAGIVRVSGEAVFVPRVAAGERVAIEFDPKKKPLRGRLLKVLEPSPARVEVPCALFDRCGGCDLMHLSRDEQQRVRLAILREQLGDVPMQYHDASPAHGRTRARLHIKPFADRVMVGFHATGSNTILDLESCGALDPALSPAIDDIRSIVRGARGAGEASIAFGADRKPVIALEWKGDLPPSAYAESDRLVREGKLAGVQLTIPGATSRVGDPRVVALGLTTPPGGFAQASEEGDRVLVQLTVQRARAEGLRVLELFAGSGNFTVALARTAAHVTAVELDPAASAAARENVRGLSNVKVVTADADAYSIPKDVDVIVLDPPRSGARGASAAIGARKIKRVVYVSCDPSTLARDLRAMEKYTIESVDAVDLFPDTSHVETIVTLTHKK
jgi:23S rRNA (uracil1939-C5)-methyltransferase